MRTSSPKSAGVEKTLKTAAEKYADNETITALAATVAEQWAAYQANPTGYFDSVELMELDTMIGGKGINDPALVETLCSNSADAIDWLGEQGITLHSVSSFGGASVKRIHRPVDAEGKTRFRGFLHDPPAGGELREGWCPDDAEHHRHRDPDR